MIRRLLIVASVLSMLLCAASACLWVRSLSTADLLSKGQFVSPQDQSFWTFGSSRGQLVWNHRHWYITGPMRLGGTIRLPVGPLRFVSDPRFQLAGQMDHHFAGFGWQRSHLPLMPTNPHRVFHQEFQGAAVPLWALTLLFASLAGVILRRLLQARFPKGHCAACGYDLCASKGRCPECGTPITLQRIA